MLFRDTSLVDQRNFVGNAFGEPRANSWETNAGRGTTATRIRLRGSDLIRQPDRQASLFQVSRIDIIHGLFEKQATLRIVDNVGER